MSRIQTSGNYSCSIIAIHGFSQNDIAKNEEYKKNPKEFIIPPGEFNVSEFIDHVLMPVSQPMGQTYDVPFTRLMEEVENNGCAKTKTISAILNWSQTLENDAYWPKELAKWGFNFKEKFNNRNGMPCFLFLRIPMSMKLDEKEESIFKELDMSGK